MKKNRQAVIAKIIEENTVTTQDELITLLTAEGFDITQATVSRDIKEMRISKRSGADGVYKYCMPATKPKEHSKKYMSILTGAAVSTDIAMNIVVLKCHAGTAQAACAALDSIGLDKTAGTLAGDDTIFILCYTPADALEVKSFLDNIIVPD